MENSTKALLIAAAILIVIIIVALAINILGSSDGTADSIDEAGDAVSVKSDEATREVLGIIDDLNNKNLINVPDSKLEFNYWYQNYFPQNPKLLLEPNTIYFLSFDYKINYADSTVGCGIGYRKNTL